ncbi:hypothetical protein [Paludisphaera mucosa]|uniref:Uncharacterized protein n=1 Tax=Paludisphaera mucosa TaxID=3030827 RepID=A0ABT6FHY0_9BACT|nr:hypothetical protein [Paludisphaera mucosa]MDG3007091.1 hypothetical protein [Paludisphaera mucosa]
MSDLLRRWLASSGFACLSACLVLAPIFLAWQWRSGTIGAAFQEPAASARTAVGAEVLETRSSDDLPDVARIVASPAEPPSWESVRRLLEARGATNLWYCVRVQWRMDDGAIEETTFVRHPYHDVAHFREFLRLVREVDPEAGPGWSASLGKVRNPGAENQDPLPDVLLAYLRKVRPWER